MNKNSKKLVYLTIVGLLTCSAASAAYWQTKRYYQARDRWSVISKQLSKNTPDSLSNLSVQQLFPLKYVEVKGRMNDKIMYISRARQGRMGYILVRPLEYTNKSGELQVILAVQGWIPQEYKHEAKHKHETFKGILRQKQKTDILHKKLKMEDIQKFNINTYIDVEKAIQEFDLKNKKICRDFYFQILKEIDDTSQNHYPYQYSVDNFQLPYLTPDKHRAYAMFWSATTVVGLSAIFKVIRMK